MKKTTKEFDTVSFFRTEKERIAKDTTDMSFEELKAYLKEKTKWLKKKADHTTMAKSEGSVSHFESPTFLSRDINLRFCYTYISTLLTLSNF